MRFRLWLAALDAASWLERKTQRLYLWTVEHASAADPSWTAEPESGER